jgi:CRISPR system Cascade subunit CasD
MRPYLIFQLHGPLAAWGEPAVGESRHSATHPGRSALLGLLAAAMGLRRDDEAAQHQLAECVRFGVKTLAMGSVLKDYHTTQVPPQERKISHYHTRKDELGSSKLGTILSSREYRQDGLWLAAVWQARDEACLDLEGLAENLAKPVFHLYLGRKSCPVSVPLNPRLIEAESLRQAFSEYHPPEELARITRSAIARYHWESCDHSGFPPTSAHAPRHDDPISRSRWQFGDRPEHFAMEETA